MASLQKKGNVWNCQFRHGGKRHTFSLGRVDEREAEAVRSRVDYLLLRIEQQLIKLPDDCDIVTFVKLDGKAPKKKSVERASVALSALRDAYLETHSNGTLEPTTLKGIRQHFGHLGRTFGDRFSVDKLRLIDLQKHVDRRAKMKGVRGNVSAATIKKEIVTLRTAWNWAVHFGLVAGRFPSKGIRYPKMEEKPAFMTWTEIERRIAASGDAKHLWECLFLQADEVEALLDHVHAEAKYPFIYPMFVFAAHTGARRSEVLRALVTDVDFESNTVLVREKKRTRGKRTTRRVPVSKRLAAALREWLDVHPGGEYLFAQVGQSPRSRKVREHPTPLTMHEAHDHFKRPLLDSKWRVIPGWHCLRHSFISNCVARGIDQRILDKWVGHTTDVRDRYIHLIPNTEQSALNLIFE